MPLISSVVRSSTSLSQTFAPWSIRTDMYWSVLLNITNSYYNRQDFCGILVHLHASLDDEASITRGHRCALENTIKLLLGLCEYWMWGPEQLFLTWGSFGVSGGVLEGLGERRPAEDIPSQSVSQCDDRRDKPGKWSREIRHNFAFRNTRLLFCI